MRKNDNVFSVKIIEEVLRELEKHKVAKTDSYLSFSKKMYDYLKKNNLLPKGAMYYKQK